jgi:hypothetical protein
MAASIGPQHNTCSTVFVVRVQMDPQLRFFLLDLSMTSYNDIMHQNKTRDWRSVLVRNRKNYQVDPLGPHDNNEGLRTIANIIIK